MAFPLPSMILILFWRMILCPWLFGSQFVLNVPCLLVWFIHTRGKSHSVLIVWIFSDLSNSNHMPPTRFFILFLYLSTSSPPATCQMFSLQWKHLHAWMDSIVRKNQSNWNVLLGFTSFAWLYRHRVTPTIRFFSLLPGHHRRANEHKNIGELYDEPIARVILFVSFISFYFCYFLLFYYINSYIFPKMKNFFSDIPPLLIIYWMQEYAIKFLVWMAAILE